MFVLHLAAITQQAEVKGKQISQKSAQAEWGTFRSAHLWLCACKLLRPGGHCLLGGRRPPWRHAACGALPGVPASLDSCSVK